MSKSAVSSNSPWEVLVGYSRAVKIGNIIAVSGTCAYDGEGNIVGRGDPRKQALQALNTIEEAIKKLGGSRQDIIRTRIYVTDINQWQEIAKAHAEFFAANLGPAPATSLVQVSRLIHPALLVEIEADAVLSED